MVPKEDEVMGVAQNVLEKTRPQRTDPPRITLHVHPTAEANRSKTSARFCFVESVIYFLQNCVEFSLCS